MSKKRLQQGNLLNKLWQLLTQSKEKPNNMKMTMKKALKKVEASKEDKLRDKKLKIKEGSKRDIKTDRAQAKRIIKKSK